MVDSSRDDKNNADVSRRREAARIPATRGVFLQDSLLDILFHANLACTLYLVYYRYVTVKMHMHKSTDEGRGQCES
jgi:hypothetical protein